jgi:NTE family protein
MINIARVIVERQQRLLSGTASQPDSGLNLVVLPVSVQVEALKFGQELGLALGRQGKALVLDGPQFDVMYGEDLASQMEMDDVGSTAVVAFMNELDLKAPFVVYVADPFASAWTRRCLGHADGVLILADPDAGPGPGAAESLLDDVEVPLKKQLVFWGRFKADNLPDVSAWTAARPGTVVNFVERGNSSQMQSLVGKLITG